MAYYFFLNDDLLPVPPPRMSLSFKNKNKTIDLINEGEINIIKTPGLTEISFDAMLPNRYYPFSNYDSSFTQSLAKSLLGGNNFAFKKASYFIDNFERHKASQAPIRLIITRMTPRYELLFDTNMLVTVEDYGVNEDAGNGLDAIVPLKLKQYRPYATKELEVTTDENGNKTATVKQVRQTAKEIPRAYQIRNEQSVWEACKRASGGSLDWRGVANLNGVLNPVNPLKGTVLNLG